MTLSKIQLTAIILLVAVFASIAEKSGKAQHSLLFAASGETHGMVYPCDCYSEPRGGFSGRAALIDSLRDVAAVVLLDAGGFAAGGIYDRDTDGRHADSLRTAAVIAAMGALRYDAVAIGDDELQWSAQWLKQLAQRFKVPLVSANCHTRDGTLLTAPFIDIQRNGLIIRITALTSPEPLLARDQDIVVKEPFGALAAIWPQMLQGADLQIVLSHLGEEQSRTIAQRFPEVDIIVNGHRKNSTNAFETIARSAIMQFGFEGKRLSLVSAIAASDSIFIENGRWAEVNHRDGLHFAPAAVDSIMADDTLGDVHVWDLYIMSQCPYGLGAIKELLPLAEKTHSVQLDIHFIGDILEHGTLKSLHGPREIGDEMQWLAIKTLQPALWQDFLYLRSVAGLSTDDAISELGLDTSLINKWIENNGVESLTSHYYRANRLDIAASPTLLWDNMPIDFELSRDRAARNLCRRSDEKPAYCDSLPACIDDRDCFAEGKIGACVHKDDRPQCVFTDAVDFDFYAIVPDTTNDYGQLEAIRTTEELFPGARISVRTPDSKEGKRLLGALKPSALPLYCFGPDVRKAANYEKIAPGLVDKGAWITFKEGVMKKQYFHNRPFRKDSLTIFIDPLFSGLGEILETVKRFSNKRGISLRPSFPEQIDGNPAVMRCREEARRWLVLSRDYPQHFWRYLTFYASASGDERHVNALDSAGIDREELAGKMKKADALLSAHESLIRAFEIREPVEALFDNRRLAPIRGPAHFKSLLHAHD